MTDVKRVRHLLNRAHSVSIVIIGLTTSIIIGGMYWLSNDDDLLPQMVNIAGQQRALTRQISFLQYQLKTAPQQNTTTLKSELRSLADTFENNHAILTGQEQVAGRDAPVTQTIQRYYSDHLLSLDERSKRYAQRARQMANLAPNALADFPTPSQAEINGLYERLDGAVSLYERVLSDKARHKKLWVLCGLLVLLLVHIVCWYLVLRPARKTILRDIEGSERDIQHMHQQQQHHNSTFESRAQFLTTISHEFRSPISAIVGALELIPNMRDKQDELVQQAEQACYRLLTLTNNLLDIMGDDILAQHAEPECFDLVALLDESIAPFSAPSRAKKLEYSMRCKTAIPTFVHGRPDAMGKVIRNVLDNAVKFTSDGFINVLVGCHVVNEHYQLTVRVIDSGIGIEEKHQQRIFERFYRVDAPEYQQFAGAGVGLAVAKKFAEQAGGSIHIASQPSIGSEFTITFPLTLSTQTEPDRVPNSAVRFAVVDDLQISRLHVSNIIRREGFSADCFTSASEFLSEKGDITQYSAIIADFYMPGINGLELVSTVTAMFGNRTPPIIMMSATPEIANIMANSNVGAWQAFVKPVDNRLLIDSLHQLAEQKFETLSSITEARILIVEDEPTNAEIMQHMVRCMGHSSVTAHNGEDALQRLDTESFDLVLLDIHLPDVSGLEIAEIIREKGLNMPIIAVTANALAAEKARTQRAGIRYHLVKPVTYQELKNTLRLTLTY